MAKRKATAKQLANLKKGRAIRKANLKKGSSKARTTTKKNKAQKVIKVAKRKYKRTTKQTQKRGMFSNVSGMLGAVAYGAVREQASEYIANSKIGQQLPVTQFTDEAVMLAVNFGARKLGLGKNPIGNSVLRAQKTVELARIGQGLRDVMTTKSANKTSPNGLMVIN